MAEVLVGVSLCTHIGNLEVQVKDVHLIHVPRGELSALDIQVIQHTRSLVNSSYVRGADVGSSIRVFPSVNFRDSSQVIDSHSELGSFLGDLGYAQTLGAQSHVQSLCVDAVNSIRDDMFKEREDNGNQSDWKEGRIVVQGSVNPPEQEVVITIRQPFRLEEELLGSFLVELRSSFSIQRHVAHMEVRVSGIFNPVLELIPLDSLDRPVPGILTLDDIEFSIESESHGGVRVVAASAVHDQRVQSVEADDGEVVSTLDQVLVDLTTSVSRFSISQPMVFFKKSKFAFTI